MNAHLNGNGRIGILSTRVTDTEEAAFRSAARDLGQSASDVLRSLVHFHLLSSSYTKGIRVRDARTRELVAELDRIWRAS